MIMGFVMAESKFPRKGVKHGEELVQRTRAAVINAFDALDKRGKVLSEILCDELENNPIKFMELAAKLMPKELHVETSHGKPANELTTEQLEQRILAIDGAIERVRRGEITAEEGAKSIH